MPSVIRIFTDQPLGPGNDLILNAAQAHYLAHVMRQGPGALIRLFNGCDGEWEGRIAAIHKKSIEIHIETQYQAQTPAPDIGLVFAPVKKAPIDQIARKATELGVSCLSPVMTERTIVTRVNTERLRANAIEAAEQCGRLDIPMITRLRPLYSVMDTWQATQPGRHILFCDEAGEARPLIEALAAPEQAALRRYTILIGPEGGFTPAERIRIREMGACIPVSLGPRILRADTAAIAALAVLQATLSAHLAMPQYKYPAPQS